MHLLCRSDAQQGKPGEEVLLQLELKLLADVGFVGVPNVGKSTLLRALTNARPKVCLHAVFPCTSVKSICLCSPNYVLNLPVLCLSCHFAAVTTALCAVQIANYPFTTLQPQLGILDVDHKQMVLADIPGLIAGASQNRGRGFAFLRHVERTRMLAYVLDLSSGASPGTGPTPLQQLADLQVGAFVEQPLASFMCFCRHPARSPSVRQALDEVLWMRRLRCRNTQKRCHRRAHS